MISPSLRSIFVNSGFEHFFLKQDLFFNFMFYQRNQQNSLGGDRALKFTKLPTTRFTEDMKVEKGRWRWHFFATFFFGYLDGGESFHSSVFFSKNEHWKNLQLERLYEELRVPLLTSSETKWRLCGRFFFVCCCGPPAHHEQRKKKRNAGCSYCRQDIGINAQMFAILFTGVVCKTRILPFFDDFLVNLLMLYTAVHNMHQHA